MKPLAFASIVFASLALAVLAVLPVAAAIGQTADGAIRVQVVSTETRRALPDVTINLTARDGRSTSATTDRDGAAVLAALPPGLYELMASRRDLTTVTEPSIRVVSRRATPVRLEMMIRDEGLDEVVATARAIQADPYGPVSSSYFNREELRSAVGAGSDVMRALDGLPGLISTGDFANFSVRGRGPRDNLIFVDGLPFDKVIHFDQTLGEEEDIGGGGRFSIFAPNSITGAEFSPGGWSAAYGGRAGSLLRLDVAGGSPPPTASLRIDIAGLEFGYEGPSGIHDGTSVFLTARSFDFGRVFEQIDEEDIGQPELSDFILKTVTDVNARNSVEVLAVVTPEDYTRDIENVLASPDFEDTALLTAEQDSSLLGVSWHRLVGQNGEWTNRLYFRDSDKTSTEGEAFPDLVPPGTPPQDIPVRDRLITVAEAETEIGWRSDLTLQNSWGQASFGLRAVRLDVDYSTLLREDWIRYVYRTDDPRPPGQDFIVLTPENVNSTFSADQTNYAAYGEQVFEFARWDLRAGMRFDRDGFAEESLLSPRLAANYRFSPALRFSAAAGIFYQSPRYLDRAANADNFNIKNERITHFSIGAERDFGDNWRLLVESYYQDLDELVVEEGRTSGRVANSGSGTSHGVDLVLNRAFDNGWSANAVYAYNKVEVRDKPGEAKHDADFSRPHFFSIGGTWEINQRWQIGARWKYASGRPTDDFVINEDVLGPGQPLRFSKELTRSNALQLENYHSLNVRVDYRRTLGPVDLVAFVDVVNVIGTGANTLEFDPRRGENVLEEFDAFPIIGIILERSW